MFASLRRYIWANPCQKLAEMGEGEEPGKQQQGLSLLFSSLLFALRSRVSVYPPHTHYAPDARIKEGFDVVMTFTAIGAKIWRGESFKAEEGNLENFLRADNGIG